jgi:predicted nuclease of predicted toxin-antitoxin system
MRFLADECCDFAAVRALRAHGHDVLAASEFQGWSVDKDLLDLALAENRILLTEDKDFANAAHALLGNAT